MKIKNLLSTAAIAMVVLFTSCADDEATQSAAEPTPTVALTSPLTSDTNVARNKVIAVNFSGPMDASTINTTTFTLKQAGTPVLGTV